MPAANLHVRAGAFNTLKVQHLKVALLQIERFAVENGNRSGGRGSGRPRRMSLKTTLFRRLSRLRGLVPLAGTCPACGEMMAAPLLKLNNFKSKTL
ncbi:hypothetical protein [Desulfovibrio sp. ZJ200]|uniref:hypothetical protein n=1 Tax=Desulfovibrio sp. ZJ200 TaxID=2709792 RepID=UPI0013EB1CBB|nr:hypothetical protein [Desulfovibrio sp. ZJ200]